MYYFLICIGIHRRIKESTSSLRPLTLLQRNIFIKIRIIRYLEPEGKLVQTPCFGIEETKLHSEEGHVPTKTAADEGVRIGVQGSWLPVWYSF